MNWSKSAASISGSARRNVSGTIPSAAHCWPLSWVMTWVIGTTTLKLSKRSSVLSCVALVRKLKTAVSTARRCCPCSWPRPYRTVSLSPARIIQCLAGRCLTASLVYVRRRIPVRCVSLTASCVSGVRRTASLLTSSMISCVRSAVRQPAITSCAAYPRWQAALLNWCGLSDLKKERVKMPKKNLVPGVDDGAKKPTKTSRAKQATLPRGSDLRPRTAPEPAPVRGIHPELLEKYDLEQNPSDTDVLGN